MSDSDSDYVDIAEKVVEEEPVDDTEQTAKTGHGRGRDIDWVEIARYSDSVKYEESEYFKDIKINFTLRKARETFYADTEHFTCKFARKRGYMKCPIEFKICFLTTCEEVVVHTNCKRHVHMEDTEYSNAGPNLVWNVAQTDIVMQGVKNEASTKVIMRNLKDSNVFAEGKFPSRSQLTVKIRHCRNIIRRTIQIFDTHELRQKISEKLDIPENSTESYIAFHEVLDDDDDKEPRFTIIWTSKKLLKRVSESLTQDDATYR